MKRTTLARNRIRRASAVGVSLFPFLAVLICTMGALILLLVIIARQARLQAAEETAVKTARIREDVQAEREWAQLEIVGYRESRQKTEAQLADARLALGHVEDHARRLAEQLAQLETTWSRLQALQADGTQKREELEAELARLKHRIADTQRQLTEAQEQAAGRRGSYAVVPYQGPNQTRRHPIYIECRPDAVLLQPEGIVLDDDDFRGPLGPGNPLDVALRATREYLLRNRQFAPHDSGEPYPLLLIRPGGIEAYYAARAAMKSWASDFGYELIGEDWKLKFPPPDPALAKEVRLAVETARVRQSRLIAMSPGRFGSTARARRYVAAPHRGGLVPENGSGDDDSRYQPRQAFGRVGDRYGSAPRGQRESASRPGPAAAQPYPQAEDQRYPPAGTAEQHGQRAGSPSPSDPKRSASVEASVRVQSLAKVRGRNWGLPGASDRAVPITSPIRIDCHPDRLVLVPEKGLGQPQVIPLGGRTEDAVDAFVSAIWQHMELWGTAGAGMYWRPILNVQVAPNAEERYSDLRTLLEGSGLEVRRNDG